MDETKRDAIIKALAYSRMVGSDVGWMGAGADAILRAAEDGPVSLSDITGVLMPLRSVYSPVRFVGEAAERVVAELRMLVSDADEKVAA